MKHVPYWAQGIFFAFALIILIFFLKIICPIDVGCLADPFLVPLFSPLRITAFLGITDLGKWEPLFIFSFWSVVGFCVGLVCENVKKNKKDVRESDEEI